MKKIIIATAILFAFIQNINAQAEYPEKFGNTLNLGAGIGYYGYVGRSLPVGFLNYEFDVFRNFTLSPFIGIYSYRDNYYWGNPNKPGNDPSYRPYSYRTTAIPVGAKASYYFDEWFHAGPRWDFYIGTSLGFVYRNVVWENGYNGDRGAYTDASPLYLTGHIGSECYLNRKLGIFLDLSSGVSTFGLAIHVAN